MNLITAAQAFSLIATVELLFFRNASAEQSCYDLSRGMIPLLELVGRVCAVSLVHQLQQRRSLLSIAAEVECEVYQSVVLSLSQLNRHAGVYHALGSLQVHYELRVGLVLRPRQTFHNLWPSVTPANRHNTTNVRVGSEPTRLETFSERQPLL